MLFGGGVTLSFSVLDEKDIHLHAVEQVQAKPAKNIPIALAKNLKENKFFVAAMKRPPVNRNAIKVEELGAKKIVKKVKLMRYKNPKCSGDKLKSWPIQARAGWHIVPNSVRIRTALRSKYSRVTGIKYTAKNQVIVSAKIINIGKCREN